ncbi:RHS repeat-associated core domain-containing protein [Rapidithrix thailandica]|uniref:RHS repeat-associated core domain-containing protein n=1 Tax=Rapidithrix thailandica TaxID=413964 RepID=A0AAW9SA55_9BACT
MGNLVWEVEYDIYGNIRSQTKGEQHFIPFRNQGQYEDIETGLYYNRFRYYDGNSGMYISQDPIGLLGNSSNFYAYALDINYEVDVFGLKCDLKAKMQPYRSDVLTKGPHADIIKKSGGKVTEALLENIGG